MFVGPPRFPGVDEPDRHTMNTTDLITKWLVDIEALNGLVQKNAGELTDAQLTWKPGTKSWSIGQCLEHLVVMGSSYNERLAPAIEQAREKQGDGEPGLWRPSVTGKLLIGIVRPGSRKARTPGVFKVDVHPRPNVVGAFIDVQNELSRLLGESRALDLSKTKLTSPASRLVRLNLGDAFSVLVLHAERHIQQAIRVRWDNKFPAA